MKNNKTYINYKKLIVEILKNNSFETEKCGVTEMILAITSTYEILRNYFPFGRIFEDEGGNLTVGWCNLKEDCTGVYVVTLSDRGLLFKDKKEPDIWQRPKYVGSIELTRILTELLRSYSKEESYSGEIYENERTH